MLASCMLFLFVGCGESASTNKTKSEDSSTMMMNAKMVDKARGIVAQENKKTNMTLDDVENAK